MGKQPWPFRLETVNATGMVIPHSLCGRGRLTGGHITASGGLNMRQHSWYHLAGIWMMS